MASSKTYRQARMMGTRQRVIVTAAASGIGRGIAEAFLEAGARVFVCDIDPVAMDRARQELPGLEGMPADVSISGDVNRLVAAVMAKWGGIDAVINNAGVAGPIGPIETLSDNEWTRTFDVNVHGAFYLIRAVAPMMKAQRNGAIINISTGSTVTGMVNRAPYVASKWALEGLTRNCARELGPHDIRVNAIRPGLVNSQRMHRIMERQAKEENITIAEVEANALKFISMRAKVEPREIGDMAVFLASDRARHVSGQIIGVCGNSEWEK